MAPTSLIILSIFILLNSLPTCFSSPPTTDTKAPRFNKIFAFGDSYTDTGNTRSTTGPYAFGYVSSPPYGTTFFHHSTNRYSDGRLVIDFVAAALSLPFLHPYLNKAADFTHGANFAVAGSTANNHELFLKNNITMDITPQSIGTQLVWFDEFLTKKMGCTGRKGGSKESCHALMEDALFWVGEIGINDYAYSFGSSLPQELIRDLAIKHVSDFLQALLDRGAKYIVVQGLPLTGCLPLTLFLAPASDRDDLGCSATANNLTYIHNSLLQAKLKELRRRHPGAIISYANYYDAHLTVMKRPPTFGITERFEVCCGSGGGTYNFDIFATCGSPDVSKACSNPAKFVNWDGVHLTEAMYKVVANLFLRRGYLRPPFSALLKEKVTR